MQKQESNQQGKFGAFFQLVKKTNPSYGKLAFAIVLSIITTLVSLMIPLMTKDLVDGFSTSSFSAGQIALVAVVFIVQALLSAYALLSKYDTGSLINFLHNKSRSPAMIFCPL